MIQSVLIAYYLHQLAPPSGYKYYNPTTPTIGQSYTLESAKLSITNQPVQRTAAIPPGAQRVLMAKMVLSADCSENIDIYSINLQRTGLGKKDDIASLYMMHNGSRIVSPRSISQKDGRVSFSFQNLHIPSCDQITLDVFADFIPQSSASGQHRLHVLSVQASATASIQNIEPVVIHSPALHAQRGTVSVEYRMLHRNLRYGSNRTVSRFILKPDSESDHLLYGITFTNKGTAKDDNLQNLYVESGGKQRTKFVQKLQGDSVYVQFDPPMLLKKNASRLFSLHSDIRSGIRKSIQFLIEEPSDIEVVPYTSRQN